VVWGLGGETRPATRLSVAFVVDRSNDLPLLRNQAASNSERQHTGIRNDALHCMETFVTAMHRNIRV
jgi:hypothetical protein